MNRRHNIFKICNSFTATDCPTRGTWFVRFMRVTTLRMGVINKQYFGITIEMEKCMF